MIDKAFLEISNICNLRCSFCHGTTRKHHMLTDAEFEALTDRLTGKVKVLYFHLLGEPLLHPSFPHFVRRAWEKGFYPILTTNGSLLQKCGQTVLENLPYKISISLHAPAANEAFADPAYFDTCIDFAKQAAAKGCIVVLRLWNVGGEGEAENVAILQKLHEAFPDEWAPSHRDSIRLSRKKEEKIFLEWGEHFEWPDKNAPDVPPDTDIFCHALRDSSAYCATARSFPVAWMPRALWRSAIFSTRRLMRSSPRRAPVRSTRISPIAAPSSRFVCVATTQEGFRRNNAVLANNMAARDPLL